jgi:hypothetical protein
MMLTQSSHLYVRWYTRISSKLIRLQTEARKDALRRNPDYVKYIQNLTSAGYFKDELEGSRLWISLEDKAAAMFSDVRREEYVIPISVTHSLMLNFQYSDATRQPFSSLVNAAISQTNFVPSAPLQDVEDSDEWLNVDAQDFDDMLEKTMGKVKAQGVSVDATDGESALEDHVANEQATRLRNLAGKVEKFVEGEGDLEGARFDE